MVGRFAAGDPVQTRLGKGTIRALRNNGQVLVEVHDRLVVLAGSEVSPLAGERPRRPVSPPRMAAPRGPHAATAEGTVAVDLHGMTVEEAVARAERALSDALLEDRAELRLIHGRSGGRIRSGLHRWLRDVGGVRGFSIDPRNAGVTIVRL